MIARTIGALLAAGIMGALAGAMPVEASGDWPTWRYAAERRGVSPHAISHDLHLHWVRELPAPQPAWPAQMDDFEKLAFDRSYEPVVAGDLLFLPSMVTDSVTAYDVDTGVERWRHYTDGPVRLAPAVWRGRVYAVSDDGHLYCLDAETGERRWRFQGGPSQRMVLGNGRLISMWSARGGPVIADGVVYFAAGVWPLEGVFLYALDAETGAVQWANRGTGATFDLHQHGGAYAFGGVAPQGHLAVSGDRLLVPGGRTPPAVFDRRTGELLYFRHSSAAVGKAAGGYRVYVQGDWFFNLRDRGSIEMYHLSDGAQHGEVNVEILTDRAFLGVERGAIFAYSSEVEVTEQEVEDRLSRGAIASRYQLRQLCALETGPVEGLERLHLMAGSTLFGSGPGGTLVALDLPEADEGARLRWRGRVEGEVFSMIAARDRLFVVTEQGRLYCFGPGRRENVERAGPRPPAAGDLGGDGNPRPTNAPPPPQPPDEWQARARALLAATGATEGYALVLGVGSGRLLDELLAQSQLHIVAVDPDEVKVEGLRRRYTEAGLYGRRIAALSGDPLAFRFPPYIASLIASEDLQAAGYGEGARFIAALFESLRPYGGAAYLPLPSEEHAAFERIVLQAEPEQGQWSVGEDHVLLRRVGALPGSDTWTHQYADSANTTYSADQRVRAPLGITWFGGVPNWKALPRHMNGPVPQVVAGRLIILGLDHISARCVYTGREMWSVELPGVGEAFTSLEHEALPAPVYFPNHPGANFIGSPYASSADSVYVIHRDRCLRLDLATGETLSTFEIPDFEALVRRLREPVPAEPKSSYAARIQEGTEPRRWGHLSLWEDMLIVGAYPHMFDDNPPGRENNWNATSSELLLALDRRTGQVRWVHQARYGFRHNAIVTAAGRTFVMDNLSTEILDALARRGIEPDTAPRIRALDARTGDVLWTFDDNVFGTWLGYSEQHDVLLQAGRWGGRRPPPDEPRDHMLALRGLDGVPLWSRAVRHTGPVALHATQARIIAGQNEESLDLLTGETVVRTHPITGGQEHWAFTRTYGCGSQNVSEHLVLFRSGAAGYTDLLADGGTGNLSGFRAGCTNNMVAADGVLNAPDYTRSCSCSYQHQTSLALAHMPEVEMWTYNTLSDPAPGAIRRVGINFGAPGARVAPDGLLWLSHPDPGGPSPEVPIQVEADPEAAWFRDHASFVVEEGEGYRWVAASGVEGVRRVRLGGLVAERPNPGGAAAFTVRLHFAEPHPIQPGERVFNVLIQGKPVLADYDIVRQAGGARRVAVVEFRGVSVLTEEVGGSGEPPARSGLVEIEFAPAAGALRPPLLSGIEVRLEE